MRSLVVTSAADVTPRPVEWLYDQRIPLGKVTVLAGRPGLGKSMLTTELAARVTCGELPGHLLHTFADVLIVTAEDDPEDTIVPRLMAAKADLRRVGFVDVRVEEDGEETPGSVALPGDAAAIADAARNLQARLIVIDPIAGFLDGQHSAYNNQEVRRALAPLAQLAQDQRCAVLCVMHLNKSTATDPLARIADSGAFTALARSVLVFGADPDDPEGEGGSRRVLTVPKNNLNKPGQHALSMAVEGCSVDGPAGPIDTARIVVTGQSIATAEDVLAGADERSASEEARVFLMGELAQGAVKNTDVTTAARTAGISETTLNRVKRRMGIRSTRPGGSGPWLWELPDRLQAPSTNGHLDHLDQQAPVLEHLEGLDSQERHRDTEDSYLQSLIDEEAIATA